MGPLIAAGLPLAIHYGPLLLEEAISLIKGLHSKVPPSAVNNPLKMSTVVSSLLPMLQTLAATGVVAPLPEDQTQVIGSLNSWAQGVYTDLKVNDQLPPPPGVDTPMIAVTTKPAASKGLTIPFSFTGTISLGLK